MIEADISFNAIASLVDELKHEHAIHMPTPAKWLILSHGNWARICAALPAYAHVQRASLEGPSRFMGLQVAIEDGNPDGDTFEVR